MCGRSAFCVTKQVEDIKMNRAYLERHDSDKDMHRFYQVHVVPGIFDEWSLVREWGKIGASGTIRKDWFNTEEEAVVASQKIVNTQQKRGYQQIGLL